MKYSLILSALLCFTMVSVGAQNQKEAFVRLIDSETSQPISFATVRFKGTSRGLIADYNGEFRMPIVYQETNNELIITSIGYRSIELFISDFKRNEINIIQLSPQVEVLDAVVINPRTAVKASTLNPRNLVKVYRRMTAKEIVKKAISKIPENLSRQPHSYVGYYRDYQLVDNEFTNLNEAIFETFDQGIQTNALSENIAPTAAYIFKQNPNFAQDTALAKAYNGNTKYIEYSEILPRGGNEYTILNTHNPIRNYNVNTFSYVYTLEKNFPELHDFLKDKIVYLNNEPLALITFKNSKQHDNSTYGLKTKKYTYVVGDIYISLVDYSIHRFNYKVFVPGTKSVLFNVSLEYARQNNQMYLNYITFNNAFVLAEDFELREEKVSFERSEQVFYITFNNTEDKLVTETINERNFKFKLGNRRLKTVSAKKRSERIIEVVVKSFDGELIDINEENIDDVSYVFKNIMDTKGREIYSGLTIKGDQFREFFVQQVNIEKPISKDLLLIDQNKPLNLAPINEFSESMRFWVNSPLMNKKYRDEEE